MVVRGLQNHLLGQIFTFDKISQLHVFVPVSNLLIKLSKIKKDKSQENATANRQ